MNNGEYIRQISNDELVVFLEDLRSCPPPLLYDSACPEEIGDKYPTYSQCKECWKKWLKEEYKKEEWE